jgi:hypothetical protein
METRKGARSGQESEVKGKRMVFIYLFQTISSRLLSFFSSNSYREMGIFSNFGHNQATFFISRASNLPWLLM